MIDFKSLEQVLSKVSQIGKGELPFEIDGTRIVLRVTDPDEDVEAQTWARAGVEGIDDAARREITFRNLLRRAILGFAIVQIDNLDLRGVDRIDTGERLPDGTPIMLPRSTALRKIVEGWSNTLQVAVFQKYNELYQRVDRDAFARIKFMPGYLDGEIEVLKKRLATLEAEKANEERLGTNPIAAITEAVATSDRLMQGNNAGTVQAVAGPPVEIEPAVNPAPEPAAPVVPRPVAPVTRQRVMPPSPPPPPPAPRPPAPDTLDDITSSLGDSEEAIAAENMRLARAREQAVRASREAMRQEETAVRRPPHAAAAQVAESLSQQQGAMELPTESIGKPRQPPPGKLEHDVAPAQSTNPRFRRPGV